MGKITLTPSQDVRAYALHVGAWDILMVNWDETTLEVEIDGLDQAIMDAGLVTYAADQANLDAALVSYMEDQAAEFERNEYDNQGEVTALIKEMVDELNAIRTNAGLPTLNFGQVNAAIRQRIGGP